MTAKEYLNQAYRLDQQISSKQEQIDALNDLATRCTASMTGMPHSPNKHSVFCSPHCAAVNERRREHATERHKQAKRSSKRMRKKLLRCSLGAVSYESLYERDAGICRICGLPVHREKGVDDYWDGTIDHIVPLSKGGEHSMSNCQLAHRVCNSLKNQCGDEFVVDWDEKKKENNYWQMRFTQYTQLMMTDQLPGPGVNLCD